MRIFVSILVSLACATSLLAQPVRFQVFDQDDKKVFTVYPTVIENPDGAKLLKYDASNQKIEDADGKRIFSIEGDSTSGFRVYRENDRDVSIAWSDGKFIRNQDLNGKVFLYYDVIDFCLRPNIGERKTHTLHRLQNGTDKLAFWQVIALGYLLKPDGFKLDAALAKRQREEAAATEKVESQRIKSRLFGDFDVAISIRPHTHEFQKAIRELMCFKLGD